jgi:hypothetical protein
MVSDEVMRSDHCCGCHHHSLRTCMSFKETKVSSHSHSSATNSLLAGRSSSKLLMWSGRCLPCNEGGPWYWVSVAPVMYCLSSSAVPRPRHNPEPSCPAATYRPARK